MRQIVLDTETTGIQVQDGHRLIEIGCIELENRKFTGRTYQQYINPERIIDPGAVAVHGITNDFLKDKPLFHTIADEFMAFVKGAELIIHNAPFDLSFLNSELSQVQKAAFKPLTDYCRITDTLIMARQKHVGQRNNLDALCKRYGIDNTKREFHGALLDARLLAEVYLAMTGGQGSFFDVLSVSESPTLSKTTEKTDLLVSRVYDLKVVKADEDELKEHEKYLQALKKQGQCQWVE